MIIVKIEKTYTELIAFDESKFTREEIETRFKDPDIDSPLYDSTVDNLSSKYYNRGTFKYKFSQKYRIVKHKEFKNFKNDIDERYLYSGGTVNTSISIHQKEIEEPHEIRNNPKKIIKILEQDENER